MKLVLMLATAPGIEPFALPHSRLGLGSWPNFYDRYCHFMGKNWRRHHDVVNTAHRNSFMNIPIRMLGSDDHPICDFAIFLPLSHSRKVLTDTHYAVFIKRREESTVRYHEVNMAQDTDFRTILTYMFPLSRNEEDILIKKYGYERVEKWRKTTCNAEILDVNKIIDFLDSEEKYREGISDNIGLFVSRLKNKILKKENYNFPSEGFGNLKENLEQQILSDARVAFDRVRNLFDIDVARRIRNFPAVTLDDNFTRRGNRLLYNAVCSVENTEMRQYRAQAVCSYPWLQGTLIKGRHPDLVAAIDETQPLSETLRHLFSEKTGRDIKKATVKRLFNQRVEGFESRDALAGDFVDYVRTLDELPYELFPGDEKGWKEFIEVYNRLKFSAGMLNRPVSSLIIDLRTEHDHQPEDGQYSFAAGGQIGSARDYLVRLKYTVVLPYFMNELRNMADESFMQRSLEQLDNGIEESSIMMRPLGNAPFRRIVKFSDKWHSQLREFNEKIAAIDVGLKPTLSWAPLTEPVTSPQGYRMIPLTCQAHLTQEHKALGHCVFVYASSCLQDSHIISMQNEKGDRVFTLELKDKDEKVSFGQLEGKKHSHPERGTLPRQAAEWYINEINGKKITVDWKAIAEARRLGNQRDVLAMSLQKIGFNPFNDQGRERAFLTFRSFLPENQRHYDYQAWLEKMRFKEAAQLWIMTHAGYNFLSSMHPAPGPHQA